MVLYLLKKNLKKIKKSKEKIPKKQEEQPGSEDNIKIYDYLNPLDNNKKADITQLKIDDIKKSDAIAKQPEKIQDKQDSVEEIKEKKEKLRESFEKKEITDDIINIAGVKNNDNYKLPATTLLDPIPQHMRGDKEDLKKEGEKLIETLNNFNIPCNILQINKGPTITRYEIQPAPGIKVSRITGLSNDIALALATSDIRMEAPIPGKSAIGIEVPNKNKTSVYLRSLIESKEYKSNDTNIPFALGKDIAGKNIIAAIDKMPHLLIAGATGSGKSVC